MVPSSQCHRNLYCCKIGFYLITGNNLHKSEAFGLYPFTLTSRSKTQINFLVNNMNMNYKAQIAILNQSIINHEDRIAELRAKAMPPSDYRGLQRVVSKLRRDVRDLEKKLVIQESFAFPENK